MEEEKVHNLAGQRGAQARMEEKRGEILHIKQAELLKLINGSENFDASVQAAKNIQPKHKTLPQRGRLIGGSEKCEKRFIEGIRL